MSDAPLMLFTTAIAVFFVLFFLPPIIAFFDYIFKKSPLAIIIGLYMRWMDYWILKYD